MIREKKNGSQHKRDGMSVKTLYRRACCFKNAERLRNTGLLTTDSGRAERLKEVFQALYEVNKRIPIIVEGRRDIFALRKIGLVGEIIPLHGGKGIYDFCEDIVGRYGRIILLMDWDEKGEGLYKIVSGHLKGLWEEFSAFREIIKVLSQKDIKDIEGIPVLLERLAGIVVTVGEVAY